MKLNAASTERFKKILAVLGEKDYIKIDNSDGVFMPLVVERLSKNVFSLSHYGEMNGDLMANPDMTFLVEGDDITPLSFQDDYMGIYTKKCDLAFCDLWLKNIEDQQRL
ncbi:DUF6908 domain-containing protein [Campylobacter sp. MOP7]|uniref:DUF6908 domain-containing protein n=1 Tax=Campylobacter canis TaxID=3378588 RepID=UPI00387E2B2B